MPLTHSIDALYADPPPPPDVIVCDAGEGLEMPEWFRCPECGDGIVIEVFGYENDPGFPETRGRPNEGEMHVYCRYEWLRIINGKHNDHQHSQSDWALVTPEVEEWVRAKVRVKV